MTARGAEPLVCPACGRAYAAEERFCESCAMPLVYAHGAKEHDPSPRRVRARKIKPQYAQGPLVEVARARGLAQAEFIAGLLLEEGIPSLLRASIAGYAPMLDPRAVMVPESGAAAAREALSFTQPERG